MITARFRYVAALVAVLAVVSASAQSPAPATFEVASVKLDPKQDRGGPVSLAEISMPWVRVLPGGRVESFGHTLRNLIAWTYDINTIYRKIEGKQEILETELVISAKSAAPSLTTAEARAMFRTLLEERFRLRWRLHPRDVDGYLLMPAREDGRPGLGLRPFTDDCSARAGNASVRFDSPDYEQKARCGWTAINGRQRGIGVSMTAIAERLTSLMATPVTDRTGWPGLFTFDFLADTQDMPINALLRPPAGHGAPRPVDAPYLLDVLRTDLGLKLVKDRATVDDFIVERVEPLIEN
jgi:uncharacterized protein (TIGR03435 family)